MYTFDSRVRYSECNEKHSMTFLSLLDYFQDCCTFQSEDLNIGLEYLAEHQVAWVLSSWQIVINRYPKMGDRIKVSTWPYAFDRFIGYRNFTMTDEKGEVLAYANSVWVFLNIVKGRPVRISEEVMKAYSKEYETAYDMEYTSRKIEIPEEGQRFDSFAVLKSDIDSNHHVNNGKYVRMAEEYLPVGYKYNQMRAEYLKAAVLGDVICPSVTVTKESATIVLSDVNGKVYAAVEFLKEQV